MLTDSLLKLLKLDVLVTNLTGYIETRVDLMKLEMKEEVARAMARFTVLVLVVSMTTLFILFSSLALAFFIGKFIGLLGGFAVVAGVYLVLLLLFLMLRGPVSTALEKKLFEQVRKR